MKSSNLGVNIYKGILDVDTSLLDLKISRRTPNNKVESASSIDS